MGNNISYKALIGAKPLGIRFHKVERFIRIYNGTRYLVLFGPEKYDEIYNRISYLISQKNDIKNVISKLIHMIICLWRFLKNNLKMVVIIKF